MPITYTNRKGVTYHLCRTVTKTGKPRDVFAREPRGEPVDEVPEGWRISESVNGIVSLVKPRPSQILPEELAAVEAALGQHPRARNYRVADKRDRIEVYERVGPDAAELVAGLPGLGLEMPGMVDRLRADLDRSAQFTPVLRFILADATKRTFRVERMCYRSSVDGWLDVHHWGPVDRLARDWIPRLGTDAFFELYG
jgi:hypothetical protein